MSAPRDLVLVGGGHTHVQVLRRFAMTRPAATRVTVVLDQPIAIYSGMVPGLVAGQYQRHELEIDVVPLARRAGARVILSPAIGIDPAAQRLAVAGRPAIAYDLLSFDVGSTVSGLDLPGVRELALPTRPIATLVERVEATIDRAREATRGTFRVVVVGAGAGGVELAFTLEHRLARERGAAVEVTLVDSATRVLAGFPQRLAQRVARAAEQRGITFRLPASVAAVEPDRVRLRDGDSLPADLVVWVAGAAPQAFLRDTALPTDERGFLRTRATLQVVGHDTVFAVGDCATLEHTPTAKAGVYAVRQGPFLIANLEAALASRPLRSYRPQRDFLTLLNLGDGTALGAKRGVVIGGRWVFGLKDWIDRRFMKRFQVLGEDGAPATDFAPMAAGPGPPMLCGGCAAKLGQSALERALSRLDPAPADNQVTLGLERPDDAAAFRTPSGDEVFVTVDAFRAFSDDPWLVGRVAALNALSDLWAKGIAPRFALALVTLPDPRHAIALTSDDPRAAGAAGATTATDAAEAGSQELLYQVLAGARVELDAHGVSLIGGHTTTGPELVVGFSVQGLRSSAETPVLYSRGARPGDSLVLTKALGTGVVLAADMQGRARGPWLRAALESMLQAGRRACELGVEHAATAATDVSGFGLAIHLGELLRSDHLGARLALSRLPRLPGAIALLGQGLRSTSHEHNAIARRGLLVEPAAAADPAIELLFDPQTSGGLLFAVPETLASALVEALRAAGYAQAAVIGVVTPPGDDVTPAHLRIEP